MKKELKELLNGSKNYIVLTDKGQAIKGLTPDLLAFYTLLTKKMVNLKGSDKEMVEDAFNVAFKDSKELLEMLLEKMKEFKEKMGGSNE